MNEDDGAAITCLLMFAAVFLLIFLHIVHVI